MSVLHVNRGPGPVVEVWRKTKEESFWCFGCRKRLPHDVVLLKYDCDPLEDWYGPWTQLECSRCHKDRTRFGE